MRMNPHDIVEPAVEIAAAMEDFDRDHRLFQVFAFGMHGLIDQILQQVGKAGGPAQQVRFQEAVEMLGDLRRIRREPDLNWNRCPHASGAILTKGLRARRAVTDLLVRFHPLLDGRPRPAST